MQAFMNPILLSLALGLCMMQPTSSGECPGIIGVLDRHTVNRTHQEVKLCWTYENVIFLNYYDIEILCKHQGEVLTPKVHLKLNAFTTIDLEAIVTLRCGSYCNVTVTAVHLDSDVIDVELKGSIDTVDHSVALTPVINKAIITTANTASLLVKSSKDVPMSCGDVQSLNVTLRHSGASPIRRKHRSRNWEWNNDGDIVLTLANISYCGLPASVSIQRRKAIVMEYQPLDAPAIIGAVVQDSALTVVFSDTAQCSNSSWEVCVTVDGQHQTERCSSRSAEDRSMTVDDAGKGSVFNVRARATIGDRHSPYSETTLLDATSVLPRDQLSLSNIGLPNIQLCYAANLPILRKATSLPKPKQFVVRYKLCGSMEERISNLSVNESCVDLQGWPGGHCYEVQLFLTLDIDGFEVSLNTTTVHQGPVLPLISLAAIPVVMIIIGCLLCAAWAKRSSVRNPDKTSRYPLSKIMVSEMPSWVEFWSQTSIEPDIQSEYITVGSEFDDEDQEKLGSYLGDGKFDNCHVTDSDYVYVRSTLSPSRSACTSTSTCTSSGGMNGQSIRFYNKEPSLLNFSSGE